MPLFGNDYKPCFEYPSRNELNKMPLHKQIKLCEIGFKKDDDGWLLAIQLKFTNGVESKVYQTKRGHGTKYPLEYIRVSGHKPIRQIGLLIRAGNNVILGMRLLDDIGNDIIKVHWKDDSLEGLKWEMQDIP